MERFPLLKRAMCLAIAFSSLGFHAMAQKNIPTTSDAEGAKILQTPEFKEFIGKYIAAVNAKDRKALQALFDPASRAAMAKEKQNAARMLEPKATIPGDYKIYVNTIAPEEPLMFQEVGAVYAVRPSAFARIDFETGPNSSSSDILFLTSTNGKWAEVWASPPDPKKMEMAFQKERDSAQAAQQAVKTSGITEYLYKADLPDEFTQNHNWVVRMTAEESKKAQYELVQIDQPEKGEAQTKVIVGPEKTATGVKNILRPNRDGFLGFKLGISINGKTQNGVIQEPLSLSGLGTGAGFSSCVTLRGTELGEVTPAGQGTALTAEGLRLIRFNTTGEKGGKTVTDVVLRPVKITEEAP